MARAVVPEVAHHVTQRGSDRRRVFSRDEDRAVYLQLLRENCKHYGTRLVGYCLMPNHVHLIVVPEKEDSLWRTLSRANGRYAQYANTLLGRTGHFWQNRFFSCVMDDNHLWTALRYLERNPVRASLVARAADWRWSSARAHLLGSDPEDLLDMELWKSRYTPREWAELLEFDPGEQEVLKLVDCTYTGRPCGSDEFEKDMEARLRRSLSAKPGGRPPKSPPDDAHLHLRMFTSAGEL